MKTIFWLCIIGVTLFYIATILPKKASNDRDWSLDQKVLSTIERRGDIVTVADVRNFTYASTTSYTPNYYTKDYDLSKLKKVWYIVE
ncbi:MAG: hypothetical protein WAV09_02730, partial [Minisyncoccia bacterium]